MCRVKAVPVEQVYLAALQYFSGSRLLLESVWALPVNHAQCGRSLHSDWPLLMSFGSSVKASRQSLNSSFHFPRVHISNINSVSMGFCTKVNFYWFWWLHCYKMCKTIIMIMKECPSRIFSHLMYYWRVVV